MVDYDPSRHRVNVNGRLIGTERAEQMIHELEDAVEAAKFHQSLPDNVNFNARAISVLQSEYDDDDTYQLGVEVSVEDGGRIPDEYFDQESDTFHTSEYNNMVNVKGLVTVNDVQDLYEETSNLVMFHVMFPNEI
jgi:hypothetical protein